MQKSKVFLLYTLVFMLMGRIGTGLIIRQALIQFNYGSGLLATPKYYCPKGFYLVSQRDRKVCVSFCGDGIVAEQQDCDDGNQQPTDGCSRDCKIQTNFECHITDIVKNGPSKCNVKYVKCNVNGVIQNKQKCDDGDTNNNNGCSNQCQVNQGWWCTNENTLLDKYISKCKYSPVRKCDMYGFYEGTCQKCTNGYSISFNKKICSKECNSGYFLAKDGKRCLNIIKGCELYDEEKSYCYSICKRCQNNYKLVQQNYKCQQDIKNCKIQNKQDPKVCLECQKGFAVYKGGCVSEIPACSKYDQADPKVCLECQKGFAVYKGGCVSEIPACSKYDQADPKVCLECQKGFAVYKGGCIKQIQFCLAYSQLDPSICQQCQKKLVFANNLCVLQIKNCLQYDISSSNAASFCVLCQPEFFLDRRNKCIPFKSCVQGVPSYSSSSLSCVKQIKDCAYYTQQSSLKVSQCTQCSFGFRLSLDMMRCYRTIQKCQLYNQFTTNLGQPLCIRCSKGYLYSSTNLKCYQQIANCIKYDQVLSSTAKSKCTKCQAGYSPLAPTSRCVTDILNCLQMVADSNPQGYVCLKCDIGHEKSTDSRACLPTSIPNCKQFDSINKVCNKCDPNYKLLPNKLVCYSGIVNCQKYHASLPICARCLPGYSLVQANKKCLQVNKVGCSGFNGVKCKGCLPQYSYITGDDCQLPQVTGCQVYHSTTHKCIKCTAGYDLALQTNQCNKIFSHYYQVFTSIGIVRVVDDAIEYPGWRRLTLEQVQLIQTSFYTRLVVNTLYCFEGGAFKIASVTSPVQYFEGSSQKCNQKLIKQTANHKYCASLSPDSLYCETCSPNYELSSDKTYCKYQLNFQNTIFTHLGEIMVLSMQKQPLPEGWRVPTQFQIRLVVANLKSTAQAYGIYAFRMGTFSGIGYGNAIKNTVGDNCHQYYAIKMSPGQIRYCKLYTSEQPNLCVQCDTGYVLSDDKLSCTIPPIAGCVVYRQYVPQCYLAN